MIFITAQSPDFYYLWQLEVQILNLNKQDIPAHKIHVLFSYDSRQELDYRVKQFISDYRCFASFFLYEDTRDSKCYPSSIRPHIIKKHLLSFERLNSEPLFYHDSDIIFRKIPNLEKLSLKETWYVSDTRSYLDLNYLRRFGEEILNEMCSIIQIEKDIVARNDIDAGGAQYIIKNTDFDFWDEVENNCERLFQYLSTCPEKIDPSDNQTKKVQAWCADMWALLWTAWKRGFDVKIDKELDFCWPSEDIKRWEQTNILHNTGVSTPNSIFDKVKFTQTSPFFKDLSYVDEKKCSIKYVDSINRINQYFYKDLSDVTFLICLKVNSTDAVENLIGIISYLTKYFKTNILLLETGETKKINAFELPSCINYIFCYSNEKEFHVTKYRNILLQRAATEIVFMYDADVVLTPIQIYDAVAMLRHQDTAMCYPYNDEVISIAKDERGEFLKSLDINKLVQKKPLRNTFNGSYGGCIGLKKSMYKDCGYENERIYGKGPDNQERHCRIKIFGLKVQRISGPLFYIEHSRTAMQEPSDKQNDLNNLSEYLKICNLTKDLLIQHVNSPVWKRSQI